MACGSPGRYTATTTGMREEPPRISVIVPVYNNTQMLRRCLTAVSASGSADSDCIVVDDGSTEDVSQAASLPGTRVLRLADGPRGPACARNAGAAAAGGDILFFVDADVVIRPDTLRNVAETFANHPDVDAVFGSYDDNPAAASFVSQFKNLHHHFVHQHASKEAGTFWSGCGAIRRHVFVSAGGFDENRYSRSSIEDIELGYRLRAAGHRILLDKHLQVQHLKQWTLRGMTESDVLDRGLPWTLLALRSRHLPKDLNLNVTGRLSGLLAGAILLYTSLLAFFCDILALPLLAALFLMVVGEMDWSDRAPRFRQISLRMELICCGLVAADAALAVRSGEFRTLPPLAILAVAILGGRWLPRAGPASTRVFAFIVLGAFGAALANVVVRLSIAVVAPVLVAVLLIVALNLRFYVFLKRTRGVTFAMAALPFHLFYYLYSVITLVTGTLIFVFGGRRRRAA